MDDKALKTIWANMPFSSVPQFEELGLYSVVQNNSGQKIVGTLEHVVEEFCGVCATYPYTLDGQDYDDWTCHVHFFDDLLHVVLENPTSFSLTDEMKEYYSEQQLQIIDSFQKALLKERAQRQSDATDQCAKTAGSGRANTEDEE